MHYIVHVYVFDNNEQDYIGDIIAIEYATIDNIKLLILTELLGPIIGYTVPFELTGVRIVGRRNGYDTVDFRDSNELFTEAINKKPNTAEVLEYNDFDLFIEIRDLNNSNGEYNRRENGALYSYPTEIDASSSSGSNRYGGKRKTKRKTMSKAKRKTNRKALKTKRHRK